MRVTTKGRKGGTQQERYGGFLLAASKEWKIKTLEQLNTALEIQDKHLSNVLEEFIQLLKNGGIIKLEKDEESLRKRLRKLYIHYPRNIAKRWRELLVEEDRIKPSDVYLWWGGEPNSDSCYAFLTLYFEVDPEDIGTSRFDRNISRNLRTIINI